MRYFINKNCDKYTDDLQRKNTLFIRCQLVCTRFYYKLTFCLVILFCLVDWSRTSSITNLLDTQYSIQCITSHIHPTMIYWTVNGLKLSNTNYTLVNESNMTYYNSTLLLYPNNELGRSVSVTCSVEGVSNETVTLKGQKPSSISNE